MNITAHVTPGDIYNGSPGNACACPVWFAIARALPWLKSLEERFSVGPLGLGFGPFSVPLPAIVHEFIGRVDNHEPVDPFSFTFQMPDDVMSLAIAGGNLAGARRDLDKVAGAIKAGRLPELTGATA
jgi:hypothetical protein